MEITNIVIEKETDSSICISKESWNKIISEFRTNKKKMTKSKLKKFIGQVDLSSDPLEFQKKIRDEW